MQKLKKNATDIHSFKVTAQQISTEPISPLLYGNFIELGYGLQVEAAWNMDKNKLVLYVCNRTDAARQSAFDVTQLAKQFTNVTVHQLTPIVLLR